MSTIDMTDLLYSHGHINKPVDIENSLAKFQFLVQMMEEAFRSFLKRDLSLFDPLVGENACELRAAYILDLVDQGDWFQKNLGQTLEKIDQVKSCLSDSEWSEKVQLDQSNYKISEGAFLQKEGLNFKISEGESFLVQSYILTRVKEMGRNHSENTNPLLLQSVAPNLSVRFFKALVREMQKELSKRSVKYIQGEALRLQNERELLLEFTSDLFVHQDHLGRVALPCYFSLKTVIARMWEKRQWILYKIHIKGDSKPLLFLFQPMEMQKLYKQVPIEEGLERTVAVWEGTSESSAETLSKAFERWTVYGIFSMNNAQHPPYFGERKGNGMAWEKARQKKKGLIQVAGFIAFSRKLGCHFENRNLFFHDHSFCDKVENQWKVIRSHSVQ